MSMPRVRSPERRSAADGRKTAKSLAGVRADDRVGTAARRVLGLCVRKLLKHLDLATAEDSDDVEQIHRLRVWSRRCIAALDLFHELFEPRDLEWLARQFKRIRRSANDARDLDVMIQRLDARAESSDDERPWREALRRERRKAQRALTAVRRRFAEKDRAARMMKRVRRAGATGRRNSPAGGNLGEWCVEPLRRLAGQLLAAFPPAAAPRRTSKQAAAVENANKAAAAWHEMRIRGKRLRYAIELLGPAVPPSWRTLAGERLVELQDRLGEVNDLATSCRWLEEKAESARGTDKADVWARLLERERAAFDAARQGLERWFQESRKAIEGPLEELVAGNQAL